MARKTQNGIAPEKSALYDRVKQAKPGTFENEVRQELERLLNTIDRLRFQSYQQSTY